MNSYPIAEGVLEIRAMPLAISVALGQKATNRLTFRLRIAQRTLTGNQTQFLLLAEAIANHIETFLSQDSYTTLRHHLPLRPALSLSTLELFDLANAMDAWASEWLLLPSLPPIRRLHPLWLLVLTAAAVGIASLLRPQPTADLAPLPDVSLLEPSLESAPVPESDRPATPPTAPNLHQSRPAARSPQTPEKPANSVDRAPPAPATRPTSPTLGASPQISPTPPATISPENPSNPSLSTRSEPISPKPINPQPTPSAAAPTAPQTPESATILAAPPAPEAAQSSLPLTAEGRSANLDRAPMPWRVTILTSDPVLEPAQKMLLQRAIAQQLGTRTLPTWLNDKIRNQPGDEPNGKIQGLIGDRQLVLGADFEPPVIIPLPDTLADYRGTLTLEVIPPQR
ncbi:MAG: hypothetical protein HC919_06785 [Oscillatoriales cyanobacterium SM2_2_1]|nr:hypothetical protein [Oscillatoriales cyanobacterium SM2_2_1]